MKIFLHIILAVLTLTFGFIMLLAYAFAGTGNIIGLCVIVAIMLALFVSGHLVIRKIFGVSQNVTDPTSVTKNSNSWIWQIVFIVILSPGIYFVLIFGIPYLFGHL